MHEWIPTSEGQTLAQLVTAQEALGNTVLQQDADNSRVLVETVSGGSGLANALVYKGATDCSGNPNYPAADAGHLYIVSVAGKIGGASGISVEAGDSFICKTDGTAAGTQAQRGASWNVVQSNIVGAIVAGAGAGGVLSGTYPNPGFAVNMAEQAEFDAIAAAKEDVVNKSTDIDADTGSDTKYPSVAAVEDYVAENAGGLSGLTTGQYVRASSATEVETDGVKRYVALLTQSGTDAPVATVLENSLGAVPAWARVSETEFTLTLASAFPSGKVWLSPHNFSYEDAIIGFGRFSDNVLKLTGAVDGIAEVPIMVVVYP